MNNLLSLNKPGPGPGTYYSSQQFRIGCKLDYKPVVIKCFFKGSDLCSVCGEPQYGDYYRDGRKRRPVCWCLQCFREALLTLSLAHLKAVRKHRHCKFVHKHMDVENITYHLLPESQIRRISLKEKALWNKFGNMVDSKGLPI